MPFDPNLINKKYYDPKTREFYIIIGYDKDVDRYVGRVTTNWLFNYYSGIASTKIESMIFSIEQFDKYLDKFYDTNKVLIKAYRKSEKSTIVKKSIIAIIECNEMINTLKSDIKFHHQAIQATQNNNRISELNDKIKINQREIQKAQKGIRRKCKVLHRFMTQDEINELLDIFKNDHTCHFSILTSTAYKYHSLIKDRDKVVEFLSNETDNKTPQIINNENINEKY